MTIRFVQTLIIILFAYQAWTMVPHDLIREGCFDPKYDRYPQWFRFPDARITALERVTATGTSIGCFGKPAQDRAGALWNERWDNRVIPLKGEDVGDLPDEIDYVYLRPGVDQDVLDWINENPERFSLVYLDGWGIIYKCE